MRKPKANIFISKELESTFDNILGSASYSSIIIIVDENTREHCLPLLQPILPNAHVIEIKSGEENKTLSTCTEIWQQMTDLQLDRKAIVVNLGGGVIGDMGGFCASTYKRGIEFIQVPTTLLSQVDASVGGKLGVDFNSFKNHIGVFKEPKAVVINTNFLKTLPAEEVRSGYAEIVKHCLIADKEKWEEISSKEYSQLVWEDLCEHSVNVKAQITETDPEERGLRKILNFGHTIGHAVESYFLNIPGRKLLHGEAIAVGMIAEAGLCVKRGFISQDEADDIKSYILSVFPQVSISQEEMEKLAPLALQDKKNENSQILCTMLEEVGKANWNIPIDQQDIFAGLNYYNQ